MPFSTPLSSPGQISLLVRGPSLRPINGMLTLPCSERRNVKVINQAAPSTQNPYLLSAAEEAKLLQEQKANEERLRVPRRPAWIRGMKHEELDQKEKAAFLEWRRSIAQWVPLVPLHLPRY